MAEGALFIAWGAPIPGREIAALEVFNEAKGFYEALQKRGEITAVEPVLLSGGNELFEGFFLLRGEQMKLATLTTQEAFIKLSTKASLTCKNLTIAPAYIGTMVPKMLEIFRNEVNTLALSYQHV